MRQSPHGMPVTNFSVATSNASQNPLILQRNDAPPRRGQHLGSYEVVARTVKFLGRREGNGGAPIGEPPPGEGDDDLPPL